MKKKIENEIILNAALGAFARYGYKKATLEDIAGELSMTNSSIYAYAASKKELYEQTGHGGNQAEGAVRKRAVLSGQ